jgi:glyoxylase-like metal-dependent hydrolase (beta-lactamase superfamily II)
MPNDGLSAVNVYVVDDGPGLVLIDGGWAVPEARAALDRGLRTLGTDVRAIRRILVTHAHRDHYTLAVQLRDETGVRVGLGLGERATISAIATSRGLAGPPALRAAGAYDLAERIEAAPGPSGPASWFGPPDEWLEPGAIELQDRILEVVATPGHTSGHIVFRDDAAGLLFAGDHVLPHITPSIGLEPVPAPSPLDDFLTSLARIRRLPDSTLLPAHGHAGGSVHARIDELVAHHDLRLQEMAEAVEAAGSATAAEVASAVGWTRRRRALHELDDFNQMLAVMETVAHLTVLVASGTLTSSGDDVTLYRPASRRTASHRAASR